ncbi:hypothetical protein GCM10010358_34940 [Streptomyces minutiscleroticus]|uniref:Uncharacterized protein n=1 Tax=Streptomyces minutiscleroticus TaxID=68238 RepID=A0A918KUU9_9ACTN|nr:hypothetical protein [Streptomyces minutiscleroticus]GGX77587.1 hypothetical protein GCM10010358_34940 [Streptomyces minutiscleroticus]
MGRTDLSDAIRLRWARLAVAAVANKYIGSHDSDARKDVELVQLRAAMIKNLGPDAGDPDRNPELLSRYITEKCGISYADISAATTEWRKLPPAEILRLRRIRNMLSAAQGIDQHLLTDSPIKRASEQWLTLVPKLP